MMSAVGLELTSFMNPDLTWKTVSKRNRSVMRRTRRPVAKSLILGIGLADKNARTPEDVTVSESEKVVVDVLVRRFSEKVENVPIKKRRILVRSPSPPPPLNPYPHLEASEQHVDFKPASDQNFGLISTRRQRVVKSDCSAQSYVASIDDEKISEVINGDKDFSGIEILAAAACSDSICNDVTEYDGNPLVEETQERILSSASSAHLEESNASLEASGCFPKDLVNESKSEGSSFLDNSSAVLDEISCDKDSAPERPLPLPDDRLLWDLNVSMDAWPCDGGTVDTQKDSFANISARSEEFQSTEPQVIKNGTSNKMVSSDVDGSNKMTSDLRIMPVGTDDLSTEKQESEGCFGYDLHLQIKEPQELKDDTTNEVVSSGVDGGNMTASDLRTMPVGTDDLSTETQESKGCSGCDLHLQIKEPQDLKDDTTNEVVLSDVNGANRTTSDLRTMPVGSDDLSTEKQECDGCSSYDSRFQTKEPQDMKNDAPNKVVSSDVDGVNMMIPDLRTMPVGSDNLSTKKHECEGCSCYDPHLQNKEPQDIKNDTTNEVVSSDVDGGSRMISDLGTMLVGTDDLSSEKKELEGCSGYDSQLQTKEPQDIKDGTTNKVVSPDADVGNRMTSDEATMPVETDDLSTEKQESGGCSGYDSHLPTNEPEDTRHDTKKEVVSSDVDGGNRLTSDSRTMPVGTDVLSIEKQESEGCSGYESHLQTMELQDIKNDISKEVVSSDVGEGNSLTLDSRAMPSGTDDLSTEKEESEGCSGYGSHLQTNGPQVIENDTTIVVVSSDVDGGNRMTSDFRTISVGTENLSTEKQESEGCSGYDSQFEDGELRESDIQCWEDAEQVDYDTEFEEQRSFGLEAESGEQELNVERGSNLELTANFKCCETGEALRKSSVSLKIRTVEVSDGETMKIDCLDGSNYDLRVDLSKVSKRESLSCVEGPMFSDVQRSRFDHCSSSHPRAERGSGSDKFAGSDRSYSHMHGRSPGGAHVFNPSSNYWDSKRQHPPIYDCPDIFERPRPKSDFGNREYPTGTDQILSEAAGVVRPGHHITREFMGSYRSPVRRSPIERVDSYSMHPRIPPIRDTSPDRNRFRRYPQGFSRSIRGEYLSNIPADNTQYIRRMPHCLDRRERSISPYGRRPHHTIPYKRARSRSRSRSLIDWLLQRDRNEGKRRRNRSPDFRSDARKDRVRLPLTKRFGADHGEFISQPRSRVSPQRNSRMFEDHNPDLDHFRVRKSHGRMIRQDQRLDQARSIRRLNSDDDFNPVIGPRRFPDRAAGGKGCKYEVSDDGKHGNRYAMIHRLRFYDTDGARRFRYNDEDSYMAKNSLTVTNETGASSRRPDDGDAPRAASEDR